VLALEDESGFSLVSPLKRTWSPRGQTPTIRTSPNHHERLNLLGAVVVLPSGHNFKLSIRSYRHSLRGEQVIAFLKQLLRRFSGEIVLVWDNHPIHKRHLVQEFITQQPRLHVYWFPICAPELNPAEFVWTQLSEYTANSAPHNMFELRHNIQAGLARTRRSQSRLQVCLYAASLSWK
jgi:transposase